MGTLLPSWVEVTAGSQVTLTCGSLNQVEWFSVHLHELEKTFYQDKVILYRLQKEHSGRYFCRGTNSVNNIFHSSAVIIVNGYSVLAENGDNHHHVRNVLS